MTARRRADQQHLALRQRQRPVRQPAHATSWPGLLPRPVRDPTRTPGT